VHNATRADGKRAASSLAKSRQQVASMLGAEADEIVFTGGATESINYALKGVVMHALSSRRTAAAAITAATDNGIADNAAAAAATDLTAHSDTAAAATETATTTTAATNNGVNRKRVRVVTSNVEHVAVSATLAYLADAFDVDVVVVAVDGEGRVVGAIIFFSFRFFFPFYLLPTTHFTLVFICKSAANVAAAVDATTVLVTIMLANNETGAINDVAAIAAAVKQINSSVLVHTDASQACGKIPVDVAELGVDLLTVAGKLSANQRKYLNVVSCVRTACIPIQHGRISFQFTKTPCTFVQATSCTRPRVWVPSTLSAARRHWCRCSTERLDTRAVAAPAPRTFC
jgi:cysteine desulfurase